MTFATTSAVPAAPRPYGIAQPSLRRMMLSSSTPTARRPGFRGKSNRGIAAFRNGPVTKQPK
jgi:hypothetical protein